MGLQSAVQLCGMRLEKSALCFIGFSEVCKKSPQSSAKRGQILSSSVRFCQAS